MQRTIRNQQRMKSRVLLLKNQISLKKYESPSVVIHIINSECGIASGSSTITPIGSYSDRTIEVKDWVNEDKGMFDIDL